MSKPAWLQSQIDDRARSAAVLGAAADQMNVCLRIAASLHAVGKSHHEDPFWQAAVRESHRLDAAAEVEGFNGQDVMDEAARRRR
jgi:hypothetical protein